MLSNNSHAAVVTKSIFHTVLIDIISTACFPGGLLNRSSSVYAF
jgi:hypothetical protein